MLRPRQRVTTGDIAGSNAADSFVLHDQLGIPSDYARSRGFSRQPEANPASLVTIEAPSARREVQLSKPCAAAWLQMRGAAANEGLTLLALSGFRSVAHQADIIRRKIARGEPLSAILAVNAAPGYSEHHTGRAVDIGTPGSAPFEECFGDTAAFQWLIRHAGSFGFTLSYPRDNLNGIAYEPWHWCWRAVQG